MKRLSLSRKAIFIGSALAVLLLGASIWWITRPTPKEASGTPKTSSSAVPEYSELGESAPDAEIPNPTPTADPNVPGGSTGDPNAAITVAEPSGNFVSTHSVSLGSNPTILSTCNTSLNAQCRITFTKDGVTKQLAAKTITEERSGASWEWKPGDLGLTEGEWQIKAIATAGSQTKTATDVMMLKVTL